MSKDRTERIELTTLCMVFRGDELLLQNRVKTDWRGYCFPGGHVEPGEFVTRSVIREMQEETGLTVENPRLCGIKEFHKAKDGKRYIVFLYTADRFTGALRSSGEGEVFWYPLSALPASGRLIDGFDDMLPVFTDGRISEVCYERQGDDLKTVYL